MRVLLLVVVTSVLNFFLQTSYAAYNRADWPHWLDEDHDCQNTRAEVLISSSQTAVTFTNSKGCVVATGRWFDKYTEKVYFQASDLQIDHVVPLKHASDHGGEAWPRANKAVYANDRRNLLAVDGPTNMRKGAKGPDQWRPPRSYWCEYAKRWILIKDTYDLSYGANETVALNEMLEACDEFIR